MNARLVQSSWFRRTLEVSTPEGTFLVEYKGLGVGESVFVNGHLASRKSRWWWIVPHFEFALGRQTASIEIHLSPLLRLDFQLSMNDAVLYREQTWEWPVPFNSTSRDTTEGICSTKHEVPLTQESRRSTLIAGYAIAMIGCLCGTAFGWAFSNEAERLTNGHVPWTVQELKELSSALLREIHPLYFVFGLAGLVLTFGGSFVIVRAKQLHPHWVFAGFLSFLGVIGLALLPMGNNPQSIKEAAESFISAFKRFRRDASIGFLIAVLITVAWAILTLGK